MNMDPKISRIVKIILTIGFFFLVGIAFLPVELIRTPGVLLDDSWAIGISLAIQNGLVFGQDIVFHYGPLSYLVLRLPIGLPVYAVILFDLFIYGHILFVLVYLYQNLKSIFGLSLALISLIIFSMLKPYNEALMIIVFFLFLFDLFYYLEHGKLAALFVAALIGILTFNIKLNPGFPITIMLVLFWVYLIIRPRWHRRATMVLFGAGYLGALGLISFYLNSDLWGYLQGASHVINAYNDAMFLKVSPQRLSTLYAALAVVGAFAVAGVLNGKKFLKDQDSFIRFVLTGLVLFLLFKYSFVRADAPHMRIFFYSAAVCLGLLVVFEKSTFRQPIFWAFVLAMLFSIQRLSNATPAFFYGQIQAFGEYIAQGISPKPMDPSQNPAYEAYRFPKEMLERIDDRTVDAIPIDIASVYINGLRYNPRPMIQSLTAYDEYLDLINFNKFASETAPDYLLFSVGDIDERHPFFPETKTKIAILSRYRQVDKTDRFLLLEKQPQTAKCTVTLSREGEAKIGRSLSLPETQNILVLRPEIEYSLAGKLLRLFYQPPILKVALRLKGGDIARFRAILPMVNNGVIANRLVDDLSTAEQFLQNYGEGGREVKSINFETRDTWGFNKQYHYQIFEVSIDPTAQSDDSADLEACIAALSEESGR